MAGAWWGAVLVAGKARNLEHVVLGGIEAWPGGRVVGVLGLC